MSEFTTRHTIPIWTFPDMDYRDPLDQWAQSANDPEQPVTGESVGRSKEACCWERALSLWVLFRDLRSDDFDAALRTLIQAKDIHTLRCLTKIVEADDRSRGLLKMEPES
jgi:hypothetical protein